MTDTATSIPRIDRTRAEGALIGARYLESLRDHREIWYRGERIADVTTHPEFREMAQSLARIYDMQHAPETRDVMTFEQENGSSSSTSARARSFSSRTQKNWDAPEIRKHLDVYLRGKKASPKDRYKLCKLAWELTGDAYGSRQQLYERLHSGDPNMMVANAYKQFDLSDGVDLVSEVSRPQDRWVAWTLLKPEENELLTRIGPETPMGCLLRRFWLPALLEKEIAGTDGDPVKLRLLGEDLVAFRDTNGDIGSSTRIAHTGAHTSISAVTKSTASAASITAGSSMRADSASTCQPSRRRARSSKVKTRSYPNRISGGVVWVYMGPPELEPELPDFEEPAASPDGARYSVRSASLLLEKDVPFDKGAASLLSSSEARDHI